MKPALTNLDHPPGKLAEGCLRKEISNIVKSVLRKVVDFTRPASIHRSRYAARSLSSKVNIAFVPKGATVYRQGFSADSLYILCSGSVKLTAVTTSGTERIARFVRPGQVFGLDSLLQEPCRRQSAVTRFHSKLGILPPRKFREILASDGEIVWRLLLQLNECVHELTDQELNLSGRRVRHRILNAFSQLQASNIIDFPRESLSVKQRELAEFIGVTEETISRELAAMRRAGILPLPNRRILR